MNSMNKHNPHNCTVYDFWSSARLRDRATFRQFVNSPCIINPTALDLLLSPRSPPRNSRDTRTKQLRIAYRTQNYTPTPQWLRKQRRTSRERMPPPSRPSTCSPSCSTASSSSTASCAPARALCVCTRCSLCRHSYRSSSSSAPGGRPRTHKRAICGAPGRISMVEGSWGIYLTWCG